jgi:hypothetical protein
MSNAIQEQLDRLFDQKDYYTAQQNYRVLTHRLTSRKKYAEAIALLKSGALRMLQHNQHNCGIELGTFL